MQNNILQIPVRHIRKVCEGECTSHCYTCNLCVCGVCGGVEGTLTTHCMNRPMTNKEANKVYDESYDFKFNEFYKLDKDIYSNPKF